MTGGAFCMRFGDPARSGASLTRLHAHIIMPAEGEKCDRQLAVEKH